MRQVRFWSNPIQSNPIQQPQMPLEVGAARIRPHAVPSQIWEPWWWERERERRRRARKQATSTVGLPPLYETRCGLDILFCAYLISSSAELIIKPPAACLHTQKNGLRCHPSATYWLAHFIATVQSLKSGNGIAFGVRPNWSSPANNKGRAAYMQAERITQQSLLTRIKSQSFLSNSPDHSDCWSSDRVGRLLSHHRLFWAQNRRIRCKGRFKYI
jgi:hypothetical protein